MCVTIVLASQVTQSAAIAINGLAIAILGQLTRGMAVLAMKETQSAVSGTVLHATATLEQQLDSLLCWR